MEKSKEPQFTGFVYGILLIAGFVFFEMCKRLLTTPFDQLDYFGQVEIAMLYMAGFFVSIILVLYFIARLVKLILWIRSRKKRSCS